MAVSGALIYIYSNDGLTQLTTFYPVIGGTTTVTITDTGAEYKADNASSVNSGTYTYSGDKVFIGLATSANATEPTYAIGDKFTFPAYASNNLNLYIVEQALPEYTLRIDGIEVTDYENVIINGVSYKCKQASVPTDLAGYKVTVPAGWTASAGYGQFLIDGESSNSGFFSSIYIGCYFDGDRFTFPGRANSVAFYSSLEVFNSSESFTITITGGTDATNQTLIQWFVDNNATFEKESA